MKENSPSTKNKRIWNRPLHSCQTCGKTFKGKTVFEIHVRTHTGEKPYSCKSCGKSFRQAAHLTSHERLACKSVESRTYKKTFPCNQCSKIFLYSNVLKRHLRTHSGEKPYICDVCGKRFSQTSHLNKHKQVVCEGVEPELECPVCERRFSYKQSLTVHMRLHTGEKPFICSICGRLFRQAGNLTIHMKGIHGTKTKLKTKLVENILCNTCGKICSGKLGYSQHVKKHAEIRTSASTTKKKSKTKDEEIKMSSFQLELVHSGFKPGMRRKCNTKDGTSATKKKSKTKDEEIKMSSFQLELVHSGFKPGMKRKCNTKDGTVMSSFKRELIQLGSNYDGELIKSEPGLQDGVSNVINKDEQAMMTSAIAGHKGKEGCIPITQDMASGQESDMSVLSATNASLLSRLENETIAHRCDTYIIIIQEDITLPQFSEQLVTMKDFNSTEKSSETNVPLCVAGENERQTADWLFQHLDQSEDFDEKVRGAGKTTVIGYVRDSKLGIKHVYDSVSEDKIVSPIENITESSSKHSVPVINITESDIGNNVIYNEEILGKTECIVAFQGASNADVDSDDHMDSSEDKVNLAEPQYISTGLQNISVNSQDISTGLHRISVNSQDISTGLHSISVNSQDISTGLQSISLNSQNVSSGLQSISVNSQNVSVNTQEKSVGFHNIACQDNVDAFECEDVENIIILSDGNILSDSSSKSCLESDEVILGKQVLVSDVVHRDSLSVCVDQDGRRLVGLLGDHVTKPVTQEYYVLVKTPNTDDGLAKPERQHVLVKQRNTDMLSSIGKQQELLFALNRDNVNEISNIEKQHKHVLVKTLDTDNDISSMDRQHSCVKSTVSSEKCGLDILANAAEIEQASNICITVYVKNEKGDIEIAQGVVVDNIIKQVAEQFMCSLPEEQREMESLQSNYSSIYGDSVNDSELHEILIKDKLPMVKMEVLDSDVLKCASNGLCSNTDNSVLQEVDCELHESVAKDKLPIVKIEVLDAEYDVLKCGSKHLCSNGENSVSQVQYDRELHDKLPIVKIEVLDAEYDDDVLKCASKDLCSNTDNPVSQVLHDYMNVVPDAIKTLNGLQEETLSVQCDIHKNISEDGAINQCVNHTRNIDKPKHETEDVYSCVDVHHSVEPDIKQIFDIILNTSSDGVTVQASCSKSPSRTVENVANLRCELSNKKELNLLNSKEITCEVCNKKELNLLIPIEEITCEICNKLFRCKHALNVHKKSHVDELVKREISEDLVYHNTAPIVHPSIVHHKVLPKLTDLDIHKKVHPAEFIKSDVIEDNFYHNTAPNMHLPAVKSLIVKAVHPPIVQQKVLSKLTDLDVHKKVCLDELIKRETSENNVYQESAPIMHQKDLSQVILQRCPTCSELFVDTDQLNIHLLNHHNFSPVVVKSVLRNRTSKEIPPDYEVSVSDDSICNVFSSTPDQKSFRGNKCSTDSMINKGTSYEQVTISSIPEQKSFRDNRCSKDSMINKGTSYEQVTLSSIPEQKSFRWNTSSQDFKMSKEICEYEQVTLSSIQEQKSFRGNTSSQDFKMSKEICEYEQVILSSIPEQKSSQDFKMSKEICDYEQVTLSSIPEQKSSQDFKMSKEICDYEQVTLSSIPEEKSFSGNVPSQDFKMSKEICEYEQVTISSIAEEKSFSGNVPSHDFKLTEEVKVDVHTSERPCSCVVCGKQFLLPLQCSYHMRTHYSVVVVGNNTEVSGVQSLERGHALLNRNSNSCEDMKNVQSESIHPGSYCDQATRVHRNESKSVENSESESKNMEDVLRRENNVGNVLKSETKNVKDVLRSESKNVKTVSEILENGDKLNEMQCEKEMTELCQERGQLYTTETNTSENIVQENTNSLELDFIENIDYPMSNINETKNKVEKAQNCDATESKIVAKPQNVMSQIQIEKGMHNVSVRSVLKCKKRNCDCKTEKVNEIKTRPVRSVLKCNKRNKDYITEKVNDAKTRPVRSLVKFNKRNIDCGTEKVNATKTRSVRSVIKCNGRNKKNYRTEKVNETKTRSNRTVIKFNKRNIDSETEKVNGIKTRSYKADKSYPCSMCCKVFEYKHVLKRHQLQHDGFKPFCCEVCGKRFFQSSNLRSHQSRHDREKHRCLVCRKTFESEAELNSHTTQMSCAKKTKSAPEFESEAKLISNVVEQCREKKSKSTTVAFESEAELFKHIPEQSYAKKTKSTPGTFKSDDEHTNQSAHQCCEDNSKPESVVNKHECPECHKVFQSSSSLTQHVLNHKGVTPSESEDELSKNLAEQSCEKKNSGSVNKHTCPDCHKVFRSSYSLTQHVLNHKGVTPSESEDELSKNLAEQSCEKKNSGSVNKHECPDCHKVFQSSYSLTRHALNHTAVKPFKCVVCGKCYRQKCHLAEHAVIHKDVDKVVCESCGKSFVHKKSLIAHQRIHTNARPFPCSVCDKRFRQSAHLAAHALTHTGVRPHVCEVCGKSFTTKSSLHVHNLMHTNTRAFSCGECGKSFQQASGLKSHIITHTLIKSFRCDVCDKLFSHAHVLKRHQLIHNDVRLYHCDACQKSFSQSSHLKIHRENHANLRLYECSVCQRRFNTPGAVRSHLMTHVQEKPFVCGDCGSRFCSAGSLKHHARKHVESYACGSCGKTFTTIYILRKHKCSL